MLQHNKLVCFSLNTLPSLILAMIVEHFLGRLLALFAKTKVEIFTSAKHIGLFC
jgi:hypothetical protein